MRMFGHTGILMVVVLAYTMVYTTHAQIERREYNRMVMDNGTNIYIAGKNALFHFSQASSEEIATVSLGPSNNTDVEVTLMEFLNGGSTHPSALMYCSSSNYNCYLLNASNILQVIENGTRIVSDHAVALSVTKTNNDQSVWYVACPHQEHYPEEDGSFCTRPGILRTNNLKDHYENFLKFKYVNVAESVQTTEYIAGFSNDSSTLFFSLQGWTTQTSHISHICHNENQEIKLTYIDMPVSCGPNNILTDVKMGKEVFVASFTNQQRSGSTVCLYNLSDIKIRLADNMRKCYDTDYQYGTPTDYILKGENRCSRKGNASFVDDILCYALDLYFGVIGDLTLTADPAIHYDDQVITAITLAQRQDTVIAFFGSDQQINKATINARDKTANKLDTHFTVDGPLQKDLLNDGVSLFALTKSKLWKFPMAKCNTKTTCHQCLTDGDPDCGWCIMGNKCSSSSECQDDYIWLPARNQGLDGCLAISRLEPDIINVQEPEGNLTVYFTKDINVAAFELSCTYRSVQEGYAFSKNVRAVPNVGPKVGITCLLPYQDVRMYMNQMKGTMFVNVYISSDISATPLVESYITYYNCNTFKRCMECVNTNWTCNWCPYASGCVDQGTGCASAVPETTITSSDKCLTSTGFSFDNSLRGDNDTLVITKDEYSIVISGTNFLQPGANLQYGCEIQLGDVAAFPATYVNTTAIECLINLTSQSTLTGTFPTKLSLKFGSSYIDGETQPVQFYDCVRLIRPVDNCGECKSFQFYKPQYKCKWCQGNCIYTRVSCPTSENPCPSPTISQVWPMSAFIHSATRIDISGYNLGSHYNDTLNAVTIAGLPCTSIEDSYVPSKKISCVVGPSNASRNGQVKISMFDGAPASGPTSQEFYFRIPRITKVCPEFGPCSGGTTIHVKGVNLDTGRQQQIYVSGMTCETTECVNSTCYDVRQPSSTLCCKTARANSTMINHDYKVDIEFDGQPLPSTEAIYRYVPDPIIESISPRTSFHAGGRNLTVIGQNLLAIQDPKIYLIVNNRRGPSISCSKNETVNRPGEQQKIYCLSPELPKRRKRLRRNLMKTQRNTLIAFEMDGVETVANLSADIASITYFPNPVIKSFPRTVTYENVLKIEGENLDMATSRQEVVVWIGSVMKCNVTVLESEIIYCNPPAKPPVDLLDHAAYFQVEVEIGNFKQKVGYIKYDREGSSNEGIIIGVACGVAVIVAVVIVGAVFYKKRVRRTKKTMEKTIYMMEKKEAKFREQCRKEFAGLQTAMSDLTGDLGGNILFRDYNVYAANVLFVNDSDHVILKPPQVTTEYSTQAMDSFKGLLRNRQFLLVLIRTLDKDRKFTMHDRSSVASILMAINNDNMEYITEILKTLLNDLVDKNVAAHSEKLLLRRSECVAEKLLTHWLSICLYHYLKEKSGSPLFILYKSIKIQVERGPVDYISNCAKFTLSEDKLLGEDISPKPITLQVTHKDDVDNDQKMISITVLECDTITQAKSKMLEMFYKNVGYTQRPFVHETQIEWLQEDSTARVLSDEDPSSLKDGIWKRINTLEYYSVPDGAKMILVRSKKSNSGVLNAAAGNQDTIKGSSKQIHRTKSGSNFWHLVIKHGSTYQLYASYGSTLHSMNENIPFGYQTKQHHSDTDEVKIASDILLPRLLVTKGTLQTYVDELFKEILCVTEDPPIIVKYLFDFLDTAAEDRGITDQEVLHTWKCNSLLLRFWVNIMKNPEFVFDIFKPDNVDKCLSVVAQAFMDSCSTADVNLGMGSPSNKLLFAKDIPRYKVMVKEYFQHIKDKPAISDQELNSYLTEKVSTMFSGDINQTSALMEMYSYAAKYRKNIVDELDNLEAESPGQYSPMTSKLQLVYMMMDRESKG